MKQSRSSRWWIAAAILALVIVLAAVIPTPYAIERPGPVINALGSMQTADGQAEVTRISGAQTYPTEGALNVLSVTINGTPDAPTNWLSVLSALLDPSAAITPLSQLYPDGLTSEERTQQNAALMQGSQLAAAAAALERLGEPVKTTLSIAGVTAGGPSDGILQEGDTVLAVGGAPVARLEDLRAQLAAAAAGAPVELLIDRNGTRSTVQVTPEAGDGGPKLGVLVSTGFSFPFDVQLELDRIGGPSAGLMLALAVYDRLTPGGLTAGLNVSGTGTIDEAGDVGPIGGLPQKLWGASSAGSDLMLMPMANCADLPSRLPSGLRIVPVATLGEAIDAIELTASGGTPPGVERCAADQSAASAQP